MDLKVKNNITGNQKNIINSDILEEKDINERKRKFQNIENYTRITVYYTRIIINS